MTADAIRPRLRTLRAEFIRKHLPIMVPLAGWICEGGCVRADGKTAAIAFARWEHLREMQARTMPSVEML